jgi:hypothetical protein
MRAVAPIALCAALALAPALGAQSADQVRDTQLKMLEHQRKVLLAMADSMPERLYRDKATPGQRDFAQQITHAAGAVALIATNTMGGSRATLPDTSTALNSRAGLRSFINAAYDHSTGILKAQTADSRAGTGNLFGQTMPRWQIWDELHMHTVWTAGQVVANFRKHGMAPPAFSFF